MGLCVAWSIKKYILSPIKGLHEFLKKGEQDVNQNKQKDPNELRSGLTASGKFSEGEMTNTTRRPSGQLSFFGTHLRNFES